MNNAQKNVKGWPKKAIKRDKRIAIYLTGPEYFFVQASARTAGLDFSSYIRGMTLQGHVNARLNEEEKLFFRSLVDLSNDLHRLVKMAWDGEVGDIALHFESCRDRVDGLFKKLKL
jgi:hypothetical protein